MKFDQDIPEYEQQLRLYKVAGSSGSIGEHTSLQKSYLFLFDISLKLEMVVLAKIKMVALPMD